MRRLVLLSSLMALCACRAPSRTLRVEPPASAPAPTATAPRPVFSSAPRPLLEARATHAATRLDDGRVFVIGGQSGFMTAVSATTELYDPATGAWTPGPPMAERRYDSVFVRLDDGRLLVAGGRGPNLKNTRAAELFDPKTFSWRPAAPLSSPRSSPMGVLLDDGTVLTCGGYDAGAIFAVCERYDPARDVWTPAEPMFESRVGGTLTRLRDGRVLATGGGQSVGITIAAAEIYDPAADAWTRVAPLHTARYGHKALVLPDGRVLVSGGNGPRYASRSEVYDPKTGVWTETGEHPSTYLHAFVYLDGRPTMFGGQHELSPLARVLTYDLKRETWTPLPPLRRARVHASATPLADGQVLIVGGEAGRDTLRSVELYSPGVAPATAAAPPTSRKVGAMLEARANHAAVRFDDGRVFVIGGQTGYAVSVHATTEVFDPRDDSWSRGPSMREARYNFGLATLSDGRLLVAGGRASSKSNTRAAELYDPRRGAWTPTAPMKEARTVFAMATLRDGTVLACGGNNNDDDTISTCERYDPAAGVWSPAAPMKQRRQSPGYALLPDGRFLVAGGIATPDTVLSSVEIYDPVADAWSSAVSMRRPRTSFSFLRLDDGRLLLAGGISDAAGQMPAEAEIYDPADGRWASVSGPTPVSAPVGALSGGRPIVFGGHRVRSQPNVESYDPVRKTWTSLPDLAQGRVYHTVTPLLDGRVLVAGGEDGPHALRSIELFRPGEVSPAPVVDAPPAARRHPERPHDYAVVIGVEGYRALPAASYADNDAAAMTRALRDIGVPEENTVVLRGARAGLSEIAKYIEEWLPRRATKDSRVFVFFSGHGAPDVESGTPYLMPWDGDATFVKSTGYPLERLYAALEKLPASAVVVALDSCFSGAGGRSVLAPGLRPLVNVRMPAATPRRVSVLAASEASEAAGGLPAAGFGAFTYHLIAGLNGAADEDADGHLTLAELHAYARKRVILDARAQNREQTPTMSTREPGLRLY